MSSALRSGSTTRTSLSEPSRGLATSVRESATSSPRASKSHASPPKRASSLWATGSCGRSWSAKPSDLIADGRLAFTGWRQDVASVLAAMDVFVMPSHFEGGPTSVLEAMAMGKAVVATDVGMVPEVIDAGNDGLVVPPGDPTALARGIGELVMNPTLRQAMSGAALRKAQSQFSVDLMVDRYLALFAKYASHRSKSA